MTTLVTRSLSNFYRCKIFVFKHDINVNQGLNFDLSDTLKKEIIQKGYLTTINHINKYLTD